MRRSGSRNLLLKARQRVSLSSSRSVAWLTMVFRNPIDTPASHNVSDRMSAGGGRNEYTPGYATPRQPENVSSPHIDEGKKDEQARDNLKSKHYEVHDQKVCLHWTRLCLRCVLTRCCRDECVVVLELSIVEDPADAMQYHKANKRRRRTRHLAQNCMAAGKQGWRTSDVGRYP